MQCAVSAPETYAISVECQDLDPKHLHIIQEAIPRLTPLVGRQVVYYPKVTLARLSQFCAEDLEIRNGFSRKTI